MKKSIDEYTGHMSLEIKYDTPYITIRINDNGIGIEQNVIDQIWDEGFSTRDSTGLGLEFIRNVIENHNGHIEISSIVGKGTKVKVLLWMQEQVILL